MSKGIEITMALFALLCTAGCGYGLIKYSLERKKISRFSITLSLAIGVIGIWGAFADYGTLRISGYIWTTIWLTKGVIELIRYRKLNVPERK